MHFCTFDCCICFIGITQLCRRRGVPGLVDACYLDVVAFHRQVLMATAFFLNEWGLPSKCPLFVWLTENGHFIISDWHTESNTLMYVYVFVVRVCVCVCYISLAGVLFRTYRQISNISRTGLGNDIVDHSDVVFVFFWRIACRRCSNNIFMLDLTPGFNGLGKSNCKTWRETSSFWELVRLILKVRW